MSFKHQPMGTIYSDKRGKATRRLRAVIHSMCYAKALAMLPFDMLVRGSGVSKIRTKAKQFHLPICIEKAVLGGDHCCDGVIGEVRLTKRIRSMRSKLITPNELFTRNALKVVRDTTECATKVRRYDLCEIVPAHGR